MGAELITTSVRSKNIKDAWANVYEQASEYSGHQDGYSGDFNTCQFTKDMTSFLKSMTTKQLDLYIAEHCPKREAWGYCIADPVQNKNKVKSQVDVTPQKGTRKWETVYKAITSWDQIEVARDRSQTECIKKARAYIESNPNASLKVIIAKELVDGNVQCATITYKKSQTEKAGLYKFIGVAAC